MIDPIHKAVTLATIAHIDQKRKFDNSPYIGHPLAVAAIVRAAGGDDNMIAAAILHDTVEDTYVDLDLIKMIFGDDIHDLVDALTRRDGETYFDFVRRTIAAGPRAARIKLADVVHNKSTLPADHGMHNRYAKTLAMLEGKV